MDIWIDIWKCNQQRTLQSFMAREKLWRWYNTYQDGWGSFLECLGGPLQGTCILEETPLQFINIVLFTFRNKNASFVFIHATWDLLIVTIRNLFNIRVSSRSLTFTKWNFIRYVWLQRFVYCMTVFFFFSWCMLSLNGCLIYRF